MSKGSPQADPLAERQLRVPAGGRALDVLGLGVVLQGQEHVRGEAELDKGDGHALADVVRVVAVGAAQLARAVAADHRRPVDRAVLPRQAPRVVLGVVRRARERDRLAGRRQARGGRVARANPHLLRRRVVQAGDAEHTAGDRGRQRDGAVVGAQRVLAGVGLAGGTVVLQLDVKRRVDRRHRRGRLDIVPGRVGRDTAEPGGLQPRLDAGRGGASTRRTWQHRRPGSGSAGTASCRAC